MIDLTENDIRKVDGFPLLKRLTTLLLSNNRIMCVPHAPRPVSRWLMAAHSRIAAGLEASLPNLEEVVLTGNHMAQLGDLKPLASLAKLTRLSLLGNPVQKLPTTGPT